MRITRDEEEIREILGLAIDNLFCAVGRTVHASEQSDPEEVRYWACSAMWMAAAAIQWLVLLGQCSLDLDGRAPGLPEEIQDLTESLRGFG